MQTPPLVRTAAAPAGIVGAAMLYAAARARSSPVYAMDSEAVWVGARNFLQHADPYLPTPQHLAFVYPPSCALLFAPVAALPNRIFVAGLLLLNLIVEVLVVVLLARTVGLRASPLRLAVAAAVLIASPFGVAAVTLGNLSIVVAGLAVAALWAVTRDRWLLGAVLLGLSLALKPIFAPAVLVFLVARRWRPLAVCMATPAVLCALTMPFLAEPLGYLAVLGDVGGGELLPLSVNSSLWGLGERHDLAALVVTALKAAVVLATVATVVAGHRLRSVSEISAVMFTPVVALMLRVRVNEPHYLFAAFPLILVLLLSAGRGYRLLGLVLSVIALAVHDRALTTDLMTILELVAIAAMPFVLRGGERDADVGYRRRSAVVSTTASPTRSEASRSTSASITQSRSPAGSSRV